jgi:N-acyl-L-homoserine lactone synthetase
MITVGTRSFSSETVRDEVSNAIHTPFWPIDVRRNDLVEAELCRIEGSDTDPFPIRVWRLSPLGVELLKEPGQEELHEGERVNLALRLGTQESRFHGVVIRTIHEVDGVKLIGVRWVEEPTAYTGDDRRVFRRWLCSDEFLPTGIAPSPVSFDDFIVFRLRDISAEGVLVLTSLRNKLIVPGTQLNATVNFPMVGFAEVSIRVVHVNVQTIDGKEYLALGATILHPSTRLRQMMGQYILQFGPPSTVKDLVDGGLLVTHASKGLSVRFVRTADEFRQVLDLRRRAYAGAHKIEEDIPSEELSDEFDTRSRILIMVHHEKVVATARLMFPEPGIQMDHEQFVSFPEDFPRHDEILEVSRVCTDRAWRRNDVLLALIRHMVLTALHARRRYIVGAAEPSLIAPYRRWGCRFTEMKFSPPGWTSDPHTVFVGDLHQLVAGRGIDPITWNILFSEISQFAMQHELLRTDPITTLRLAFYRLFRAFASWSFNRKLLKAQLVA